MKSAGLGTYVGYLLTRTNNLPGGSRRKRRTGKTW